MGFPLGPLLANIYMIALAEQTFLLLKNNIISWRGYIDDTCAYFKPNKIIHMLNILDSYHPKIGFTYELEKNNKISFLDILWKRKLKNKFEAIVFRKSTNTYIYMNCNANAPSDRKIGTLKTLNKRAKTICSHGNWFKTEIEHLRKVFVERNSYPRHIVNIVI